MKNRIFEVIDFESDYSNFNTDFKTLSKRYGREYVEICKAMWEANFGVLTEEEFMKMNGEMPKAFFDKVVKGNKKGR